MTLIEAAARLGVTPDNLRGAIKRGTLQAVKHGRDWWVEPAEVERYGRENRRTFISTSTDVIAGGQDRGSTHERRGLVPHTGFEPAHARMTART